MVERRPRGEGVSHGKCPVSRVHRGIPQNSAEKQSGRSGQQQEPRRPCRTDAHVTLENGGEATVRRTGRTSHSNQRHEHKNGNHRDQQCGERALRRDRDQFSALPLPDLTHHQGDQQHHCCGHSKDPPGA